MSTYPTGMITGGVQGIYDPEVPEELRVRDGLPNAFAKLDAGGTVRIAYIGGSITEADGWRPMTFAWLEKEYPRATLVQIDAAVSGTGADFAACRAGPDLLSHQPDLVFVEYRVNGGGGFEARAIEGLVRRIRQANPETDVCLVYTIGEWMLDDLQQGRQFYFGRIMETLANRYGIPSIDLGVEVVKQLAAGDLVFKGEIPVEGKLLFSRDGVHPLDDGHALYCDIITRSLRSMKGSGQVGKHPMPAPVEEKHFSNASLVPVSEATLSSGWDRVDTETDAVYRRDARRTHDMLRGAVRCEREGETLTITWHGELICFTTIPQGDGMAAEVSIDGGPPTPFTFTQGSDKHLYAQFVYAPEQSSGPHTAVLTVTKLPEGTVFYCGQCLVIDQP